MTKTQTTNEAAERLLRLHRRLIRGMDRFWQNEDTDLLADSMTRLRQTHTTMLDKALAAERLLERQATVERIREQMQDRQPPSNAHQWRGWFAAILDEEAAASGEKP